jgi:hypothetical protein
VAFVHKPETYWSGKTDAWAWRCNFVGYVQGGKGWIFCVPTNNTFFESSIAVFPYSTTSSTNPPAPPKTKLTLSELLNKILHNGPDPEDFPQHLFDEAIKQSDLAPDKIPKVVEDAPVRQLIDKLLNTEDITPMIFNAALVLGSDQA